MVQVDEFTYRLLEILRNSPLPLYEYLLAFLSKKMYSRKGSAVTKNYTRLTCKNKKGNFTILGATFSRGSELGLIFDGEPYASRHTILYSGGKKPKFVGCKIRSMRSRLVFLLSGVFTPLRWHHLKRTWTRSRDLK